MERRWGIYYIKGVTVRFGFDVLELRKFKQVVKNKATGMVNISKMMNNWPFMT